MTIPLRPSGVLLAASLALTGCAESPGWKWPLYYAGHDIDDYWVSATTITHGTFSTRVLVEFRQHNDHNHRLHLIYCTGFCLDRPLVIALEPPSGSDTERK